MTVKKENLLNNAVFFFFALFLFSSSLSVAVSQGFFGIALFFFVIFAVVTRYNPFSKNVRAFYLAILIFFAWLLLSYLANDADLTYLSREWLFCIVPVGVFLFRQKHYRSPLVFSLALGVILASAYGVIQHFTGANWYKDFPLTPARDNTFYAAGGFGSNMIYGNYTATAAIFFLSLTMLKWRSIKLTYEWYIPIAGILAFIGNILSYSRMAIAALFFGVLSIAWVKGRRWFMAAIVVSVAAAVPAFLILPELAFRYELALKQDLAGEIDSSRYFIWKRSFNIVIDNPVFGIGRGNFEKEYTRYLDMEKTNARTRPHAHNDFLNYAAIAGVPGAILYISIWLFWYRNLRKTLKESELSEDRRAFTTAAALAGFAFLLTSLTEATFYANVAVRQLIMVVWAAGLWPLMSKGTDENLLKAESA